MYIDVVVTKIENEYSLEQKKCSVKSELSLDFAKSYLMENIFEFKCV